MKTAVSFFEQNGGTYTRFGDVLLPNLTLEETDSKRPVIYSAMLLNDELYEHLSEIDQACEERMELLTRQLAKQEGVTEALKAADQMEWVRRMNNIRSCAEEIVLNELVYPEEAQDANS